MFPFPSVEGEQWVPVQEFRAAHALPADFGVEMFAPKDFTGLGSIDRAGDALHQVGQRVLDYIPNQPPPEGWIAFGLQLQLYFHRLLAEINPLVGLRSSEIEFASAGFGDVIQAYLLALLKAHITAQPTPEFRMVYRQWLERSELISSVTFRYEHQGERWGVRLAKNNYGLTGMVIDTSDDRYYVSDPVYACPAAGFMTRLLQDCTQRLQSILKAAVPVEVGKSS